MGLKFQHDLAKETTGGVSCISGFGRPFGVCRDSEGRLLVTDMDLHSVFRFTSDLRAYQSLMNDQGWSDYQQLQCGTINPSPKRFPRRFDGPHSVAVAPDGRLFVTTYYSPKVHIIPPDGGLGVVVGGRGKTPCLKGPATGILDANDRLLVTEYGLHGIFTYNLSGAFLGALGGGREGFRELHKFSAGTGVASFDRPHMCKPFPGGDLVVADTWNHRLQRFTRNGTFIGVLDGGRDGWRQRDDLIPKNNRSAAGFNLPVAIGLADDGRFVVTDWGNNRLQWFDEEGRHLLTADNLGLDKPYDAQIFEGQCVIANTHKGMLLIMDI